jgi:hypothetical protein
VSSVGPTNAVGFSGHSNWALASDLPIHREVKNCVHYVALHELRSNFPSDSIGVGPEGKIPEGCHELFCPGAHSDVGGGYAGGMQGKGCYEVSMDPDYPISRGGAARVIRDDGMRISQFTLNEMLDAAKKTCLGHEPMPWIDFDSELGRGLQLAGRFAMTADRGSAPWVSQAVTSYLNQLSNVTQGLSVRDALREHGLRYLAWRYRVTRDKRFATLPSVRRAGLLREESLEGYLKGQKILEKQILLLSTRPPVIDLNFSGDKDTRNGFHPNASEIFEKMKSLRLEGGLETFFDKWVHDSYAGFISKFDTPGSNWFKQQLGPITHIVAEAQRYVRWRGVYCGGDEQLNSQLPIRSDQRRMA